MYGYCKLCGLNSKLSDSHIIPESFYAKMLAGAPHLLLITNQPVPPKRNRKGIYGQFLCDKCETSFSEVDDHAAVFFNQILDRQNAKLFADDVLTVSEFYKRAENFDYRKIKKFFASILWRSSVCEREEFARIKLAEFEDMLRLTILGLFNIDHVPLEICARQYLPSAKVKGAHYGFLNPWPTKIDGAFCFRFIFGGYEFNCFLGEKPKSLAIQSVCMQKEKAWIIPLISFDTSKTMQAFLNMAEVRNSKTRSIRPQKKE